MVRSLELVAGAFLGVLALTIPAAGQALPEYSAGTAGTTGAAGASGGIGKSIGEMIGNLDKTLASSESANKEDAAKKPDSGPSKPAAATPRRSQKGRPATTAAVHPTAPPVPKYEDPNQIPVNLAYDEMMRRFGPPAMEITTDSSVQKLLYATPSGMVHIEVVGGVVTSAPKPKS